MPVHKKQSAVCAEVYRNNFTETVWGVAVAQLQKDVKSEEFRWQCQERPDGTAGAYFVILSLLFMQYGAVTKEEQYGEQQAMLLKLHRATPETLYCTV